MYRSITFVHAGEQRAVPASHIETIEQARLIVCASFWKTPLPADFLLKYLDSDQDLVTVDSSDDWREMLRHFTAAGSAVVRVFVVTRVVGSSLPAAVAASSPAIPSPSSSTTAVTTPSVVGGTVDGTQTVVAGARFRQRWTLRNTGSATWPQGCRMVHQRGETFGAFPNFLVASAAPGSSVTIEVNFTAPRALGSFESVWRLMTPAGDALGEPVLVRISTENTTSPTVFPGLPPGQVFNVFPGLYSSPTVSTATLKPFANNNNSTPARHIVPPGSRFMRRWIIRNSSNAAWPEGVRARRETGKHSFGLFDSFQVPALAPGAETTIEVSLVAPTATGDYDSVWVLRRPDNSIIPDTMIELALTVQHPKTNSGSAIASFSSSSSTTATPTTRTSDRHPILSQVTSMSEDELTKLFNTFVSL